jgi:hypothetical protein
MDEFEWEKSLRESDAVTDKYLRLIDKYGDGPAAEKQIASEMGWDWVVEVLEAEERGELRSDNEADTLDKIESLEPNPLTEGVDWVRDDDGEIVHPLALVGKYLALALWKHCSKRGLLGETTDPDLHEMVFQSQVLAAKLAGALNHLGYDTEEPGFVVACLKRALTPLNQCLHAAELVEQKNLLEPERIQALRDGSFGIREQMLALMSRFRQQQM